MYLVDDCLDYRRAGEISTQTATHAPDEDIYIYRGKLEDRQDEVAQSERG